MLFQWKLAQDKQISSDQTEGKKSAHTGSLSEELKTEQQLVKVGFYSSMFWVNMTVTAYHVYTKTWRTYKHNYFSLQYNTVTKYDQTYARMVNNKTSSCVQCGFTSHALTCWANTCSSGSFFFTFHICFICKKKIKTVMQRNISPSELVNSAYLCLEQSFIGKINKCFVFPFQDKCCFSGERHWSIFVYRD